MDFEEVNLQNFKFNPFSMLFKDWALVAAGDEQNHNAMTVSWGGFGVLWNRFVATIYIRPQRFTKKFVDSNNQFTINFFDEQFKSALQFCGTNSGENCDKDLQTGLKAINFKTAVGYKQSKLVFVCKKLYVDQFKSENFVNVNINDTFYVNDDFHFIYFAEIEHLFIKK